MDEDRSTERQAASLSRRRALALAGGAAGLLSGLLPASFAAAESDPAGSDPSQSDGAADQLPTRRMEQILRARGKTSHGLFLVKMVRKDLNVTGMNGITISPPWQLFHLFTFQALPRGGAMTNVDLCLLASETQPVIDRLLARGFTLDAFHQHFYDLAPMVYFINARSKGEPVALAQSLADVMAATSTPLPQEDGGGGKTPLDADRLGAVLGARPHVGEQGVVTFFLPRKEQITLGGVRVNPYLHIATNVVFQPLDSAGRRAAAAPDFAMVASEIGPVLRVMRRNGFTVGCLYNQATDEHPQLFYSHQMAIGDPLDLARRIRQGLDQTNLRFVAHSARAPE